MDFAQSAQADRHRFAIEQASGIIPSLDGIRAVSILIVLLGHARVSPLIPGGFGVTVFFFLSGFLITMLLTREFDRYGCIAVRAFYMRRVVRLGPPLLITLFLSICAARLGLVGGEPGFGATISQILFYYNYYNITHSDIDTVNGLNVLWSLSVEEHFYLIWPAIFVLLSRGSIRLVHIIWLLAAILAWRYIRFYVVGSDEWTIYITTDTRFDSLLYGCILALLIWRGDARRLFPAGRAAVAICVFALAMLLFAFVWRDDAFRSTLRYTIQGLALTPLFYYAVAYPDSPVFRPLNWAPVRRIGVYSYTMYLAHYVIIGILKNLGLDISNSIVFTPVAIAASIVYAALLYEIAEKPFQPLRARLKGH